MLLENIKIVTVGDVHSGTSATTGKAWSARNILLSFEDEEGENYMLAGVDSEVWARLGISQGETVNLSVRFRTKRFNNGYVANDIRIVSPENAL